MINEQNTAAGSLPEQKAVSKYGWQIPNSYIALDLETTGLNPKRDKMIEIGAVRVEDGAETGRFHTMLNPRRELEERITELTGIRGICWRTRRTLWIFWRNFLLSVENFRCLATASFSITVL